MTGYNQVAMKALLGAIEAGDFPSGSHGYARQVWPYVSLPSIDCGLLARQAFDGSLDAAKALHDALLPGWDLSICTYEDDLFEVSVSRPTSVQTYDGLSEVIARAWLISALRALISEGMHNDRD
jgi:hypothetical protein